MILLLLHFPLLLFLLLLASSLFPLPPSSFILLLSNLYHPLHSFLSPSSLPHCPSLYAFPACSNSPSTSHCEAQECCNLILSDDGIYESLTASQPLVCQSPRLCWSCSLTAATYTSFPHVGHASHLCEGDTSPRGTSQVVHLRGITHLLTELQLSPWLKHHSHGQMGSPPACSISECGRVKPLLSGGG